MLHYCIACYTIALQTNERRRNNLDHLQELRETVLDLINSNLSAGKISRMADIPQTTISRLRNGDVLLENMSFKNIGKLYYTSKNNENITK